MAERLTDRQLLALRLKTLTDAEVRELLNYLSLMGLRTGLRSAPSAVDDDLIASLADNVENRRARQTFEWETARRLAAMRAADQTDS